MSIHTMDEATAGLTPLEVWARRGVYHQARRILIDPSTSYEWNPRGYLERIEFRIGGYVQVLTAHGGNGEIGSMFYLLFDEAARLIEIEKKIDAEKSHDRPLRTNWVHHVDFEHGGFVTIHRHDGTVRSYKPSAAGMQRLRNVIDMLAWSWRPPTTLDSQSMRIKNRAIAPMRRFQ